MGSESMTFDHAFEALPQWLLTAINLAGVLTLTMLRI